MNFPRDVNDEKFALCIVNTWFLPNAINDTLAQIVMLMNWGFEMDNIYILIDGKEDSRLEFISKLVRNGKKCNIKTNNGQNFLTIYQEILRTIAVKASRNASLYVSITGHGGQTKDNNGDEKDGKDEFIAPNGVMVRDDDLYRGLQILGSNFFIMGFVDTCHSGTMFDLDSSKFGKLKCTAFSISACSDSEVDWETICPTTSLKNFAKTNFNSADYKRYNNYLSPSFITGSLTAGIIKTSFNGINSNSLKDLSTFLKAFRQTLYINSSRDAEEVLPPPNNNTTSFPTWAYVLIGIGSFIIICLAIFLSYYYWSKMPYVPVVGPAYPYYPQRRYPYGGSPVVEIIEPVVVI